MVTIKDVAADAETVPEAVQRQRTQKQMMVLILFLALQKYYVAGIASTGAKN